MRSLLKATDTIFWKCRHHQIRCQLAQIGCPIKGDLKYGAKRSNPDGGISLHARHIHFIHPVSQKEIDVTAPVPDDALWKMFEQTVSNNRSTEGANDETKS